MIADNFWDGVYLVTMAFNIGFIGWCVGENSRERALYACAREHNVYACEWQAVPKQQEKAPK